MENLGKRKGFQEAVDCFTSKGYTVLSTPLEYVNSNTPLLVKCKNNHESKIRWSRIKHKEQHHCKMCNIGNNGKKKWTIAAVIDLFRTHNYQVLSKEYKNVHEKMQVMCGLGHKGEINLKHFQNGVRCTKCKVYKKEELCRKFFEKYTGNSFPKSKPSWLVNPNTGKKLELDGYSEDLKIAFEYDGEFHYSDTRIGTKRVKDTEKQTARDSIKDVVCARVGVKLIRIPYHIDNLEEYIKHQLDKVRK